MVTEPSAKSRRPHGRNGHADGSLRLHPALARSTRFVSQHYLAVLAAASLVLYVFAWPENRIEADDGYFYAYKVEQGGDALNARHLLYEPSMRLVLVLSRLVHRDITAHTVMSVVSLVAALLTVCLVAWIIRELFHRSVWVALSAAACLTVSYGFWRYATEAEVYALAAFLTLAAIALAFGRIDTVGIITAGVIAATAVLVHAGTAAAVLFAVPIGLLRADSIRRTLTYTATAGSLILLIGIAATHITDSQIGALGARPADSGLVTYAASFVGAGQTVLSGNFLFSYPAFTGALEGAFPARSFVEETFLGQHATLITRTVGPVSAILALGALGYALAIAWRRRGDGSAVPAPRGPATAIVSWFAALSIVGVLGSGGEPEGWLMVLPAAAIALGAWVLPHVAHARPGLLVALPTLLLLHNSVAGLQMLQSADSDYNRVTTSWLLAAISPDDAVITGGDHDLTAFIRYHSEAAVYPMNEHTAEQLEGVISGPVTGDVYMTSDVLEPSGPLVNIYPDSFAAQQATEAERRQFVESIDHRLELVHRQEIGSDVYVVR